FSRSTYMPIVLVDDSVRWPTAACPLRLAALDLAFEVVHGGFPERPVVGDPGVYPPQRAGIESVDAPPPFGTNGGETLFPQDLQLLRDCRLRNRELATDQFDQVPGRVLTGGQHLDQP